MTAIEYSDGTKEWYLNGKYHRIDGPALEYSDGYKEWWIHGVRHRENGPAIEYLDGTKEYWIHGKKLNESNILKKIRFVTDDWQISMDYKEILL